MEGAGRRGGGEGEKQIGMNGKVWRRGGGGKLVDEEKIGKEGKWG